MHLPLPSSSTICRLWKNETKWPTCGLCTYICFRSRSCSYTDICACPPDLQFVDSTHVWTGRREDGLQLHTYTLFFVWQTERRQDRIGVSGCCSQCSGQDQSSWRLSSDQKVQSRRNTRISGMYRRNLWLYILSFVPYAPMNTTWRPRCGWGFPPRTPLSSHRHPLLPEHPLIVREEWFGKSLHF